jgi:hypothetical protein
LRKQFLIWRTLKQGERERYLTQTEGGGSSAGPVGAPVVLPAE